MLDVQIDAGPHSFFISIMKYLYIDESFDEKLFVVGGILVDSENDLFLVYNQFKKQFNEIPMTRKQKERISFELKSTILESSYPQIKRKLLYKLNLLNCDIVFSYRELDRKLTQDIKEDYYLSCLKQIASNVLDDLTIITVDELGSVKFETKVINELSNIDNVKLIKKDYSFANKGLQFADNVVGVVRKHIGNLDEENFYDIIAKKVKRIG